MPNSSYPYIANPDRSPSSTHYDDSSHGDSKLLPTPADTPTGEQFRQHFSTLGYTPSQASHTPAAHLAMKNMSIDHHTAGEDMPDFSHSSRQSVSSRGQDSPSTPNMENSVSQEERPGLYKIPTNDFRQGAPRVELFRTESAACADELFNPENFATSSAPSLSRPTPTTTNDNNFLSPTHNLVNERIRTANSVRSHSPAQSTSRDRSPFRTGSPLAPTSEGFKTPGAFMTSAANSRRQQKEEASVQEWSKHQPTLRREPTKTMSPRDAVLDYNEADASSDMPLFADSIPPGYQKHYGGQEVFLNNFINTTNQQFGNIAATAQPNMAGFRASPAETASGNANFNFLPPAAPAQMPSNSYKAQQYKPANMPTEQTPEFPAHLTSMESSISEGCAPASSQGSAVSIIPRPAHTQANTGTYTCTFAGCSQRFDSSLRLQRHKREVHEQRPTRDSYSSEASTTSPEHSASPELIDTLGSGMTSAALAARNSQTGPHKCTRINPSTGKPCNTIFSRPYDLTRHEDTIHNRGKQKVRCQYCREEKTFSRNDALTRHMRVVHPEVDFTGKRTTKKGDQF